MNESILNGLLHLFAIAVSLDPDSEEKAEGFIEAYLVQALGISQPKEYILLYKEFLELQTELKDQFNIFSSLSEKLQSQLSHIEHYIVLMHFFELLRCIDSQSDDFNTLMQLLQKIFKIEKSHFDDMLLFIFQKNYFEGFNQNFLVLESEESMHLTLCHRIVKPGFRAPFVIFKIPDLELICCKALNDQLFINTNPVYPNVFIVLTNGSFLRDALMNTIYFDEIEAYFRPVTLNPNQLVFQGKDINFTFKNSQNGLHNFSFHTKTGNLIGIMGASGAGKTTLFNILNGSLKPNSGEIKINNIDLYQNKEKIKGVIGYVPQDDLLIEDLTVYENLYYAIRFSCNDLSPSETHEKIIKILHALNQTETAHLKVGNALSKTISGGQRKRLNIALELIREPDILFVDEPTSGLSSMDSENVMQLLKTLTKKGKLIIVNIHQPSSNIYKMFDELWILDKGGYPIFMGNPFDAVQYFREAVNIVDASSYMCPDCQHINPEQMFSIIETKKLNENGVFTSERKFSPKHWHDLYLKKFPPNPSMEEEVVATPNSHLVTPGFFSQTALFLKRNFFSKITNLQYMLINMLEPIILSVLISFFTRYQESVYIFNENRNIVIFYFMSIIVSIFLGLSVSADEIVKDRLILLREQFLNLSWIAYCTAKIVYLAGLLSCQLFLFSWLSVSILKIPDSLFKIWFMLFACALFSAVLGLNISSAFKKSVTIYILIPLLLIPQILLCGMVVKFEDIVSKTSGNNYVPWYSDVLVSRWGFEGLIVDQFANNSYQKHFFEAEKHIARLVYVRDDLIDNLASKMDYVILMKNTGENKQMMPYYLKIIRNTLAQIESSTGVSSGIHQKWLTESGFNETVKQKIQTYCRQVIKSLDPQIDSYKFHKEDIRNDLLETLKSTGFIQLKQFNYNQAIADLVENTKDYKTIRLSGERFVQVSMPIYQKPVSKWGRTVFFSAEKLFGSKIISTYQYNCIVIIFMTLLFVGVLYLNIFSKITAIKRK